MLSRIARDTGITCVLFIMIALVVWPGEWAIPLGVIGGGLLMGVSFWVIRGTVNTLIGRIGAGETTSFARGSRAGFGLVKFFTRYAMLAFAAYVMMARLHLDAVGMLAGVSALGVAAGVEALREMRAPGVGRRG